MVCIRIERNFFGIRSCELWLTRNYFSFYSVLKTEREEIIFPFNPWAVWLLLSSWCGVHFLFSWCFVAVESDCTLLVLQQNFHNFCSLVSTSVLLPHRSSFIKGCNPNLMKRLRGNSSLKKVRQRGDYVKKKKKQRIKKGTISLVKREPYPCLCCSKIWGLSLSEHSNSRRGVTNFWKPFLNGRLALVLSSNLFISSFSLFSLW